jgi:hypothetical protein
MNELPPGLTRQGFAFRYQPSPDRQPVYLHPLDWPLSILELILKMRADGHEKVKTIMEGNAATVLDKRVESRDEKPVLPPNVYLDEGSYWGFTPDGGDDSLLIDEAVTIDMLKLILAHKQWVLDKVMTPLERHLTQQVHALRGKLKDIADMGRDADNAEVQFIGRMAHDTVSKHSS